MQNKGLSDLRYLKYELPSNLTQFSYNGYIRLTKMLIKIILQVLIGLIWLIEFFKLGFFKP